MTPASSSSVAPDALKVATNAPSWRLQPIALILARTRHSCTSGGVDLTAEPYGSDMRAGQPHRNPLYEEGTPQRRATQGDKLHSHRRDRRRHRSTLKLVPPRARLLRPASPRAGTGGLART